MRPVAWISEPALQAPCERIRVGGNAPMFVTSAVQLLEATAEPSIVFVDAAALEALEQISITQPVIVIAHDLPTSVNWLRPHTWISHVVSVSMLDHPLFASHLTNLVRTLSSDDEPRLLDWLGADVAGRRVRLTHASRRTERLEMMGEFLSSQGVGTRTSQQLRDAAEELLTNAFYDAPVAAGAVPQPISRTQDVSLPDKYACDLAYGCYADLSVVRVRDPFGSLTRERLVEVLSRCSRSDMTVEVDESMGGAGLGMWRIFTVASYVAISVVQHRHTEILVGIGKRSNGPRPFAFHLFFREGKRRRFWQLFNDETSQPSVNRSVLLELTSK